MCKIPKQRRGVFLPGEAESIVDLAAALIVRHPITVPGLLSSIELAARLSNQGITMEHVTRAVDEWLARAGVRRLANRQCDEAAECRSEEPTDVDEQCAKASDPEETMNAAQHAFVREQFAKWVKVTDVAEQCGLTRKEMIESVEFKDPQGELPSVEEGKPTENPRAGRPMFPYRTFWGYLQLLFRR